jgi:hypothetical protein
MVLGISAFLNFAWEQQYDSKNKQSSVRGKLMPLFIKSCLKKCVSVSPAIMLPEKS